VKEKEAKEGLVALIVRIMINDSK